MAQVIASTYEIIEELGSGGGGIAYLAYHLRLHKKVVLKADKRKALFQIAKFRREVDILKELSHTYIPQVYDYFIDQDTAITVIDYIEGESLDKPLKQGERFSQSQVIKWAVQLLEALSYLHNPTHGDPPRGYVHSDIKPANIMRRPNGDICLIDFNIALALGEETAVGRSEGYASPEHYGLDYSSGSGTASRTTDTGDTEEATMTQSDSVTMTAPWESGCSRAPVRKILPDVRSDIYSLGATLYHLLSGKRPAQDANDVEPLSKEKFSPPLVDIISKAMNPNPDLRYQSAMEMREAILDLWSNDPRVKRQKRRTLAASIVCAVLFAIGICCTFTGLKRMQIRDQWEKLAGMSEHALEDGDRVRAVTYAMQALDKTSDLFQPNYLPAAQKALTDALGVYDLADGFQPYQTVDLPTKPLYMGASPGGTTVICLCSGAFVVIDTESGDILTSLPAERSAYSEAEYLDEKTIIYAGIDGITAYDLQTQQVLWTGLPATAISISGDGTRVVGVYKDQTYATEYDTATGTIVGTVDFGTRHQYIPENDQFENLDTSTFYNLLSLNEDGTLLGVSFSTGELQIRNLQNPEDIMILAEPEEGYTHFEGGFYQHYFAVSASQKDLSVFALLDTEQRVLIPVNDWGAYQTWYRVHCNDNGIFVSQQNKLMQVLPETGSAKSLTTLDTWVEHFATDAEKTLVGLKDEFVFFDANAIEKDRHEYKVGPDFLLLEGDIAIVGSRNDASIRILKYKMNPEQELVAYDPQFILSEARIGADGETFLLFSHSVIRVMDIQGSLLKQVEIPDPEQVYDQQFIRNKDDVWLEVTYYDGHVVRYSAADGMILSEDQEDPPDRSLYEVLTTENYRVESPLHGTPELYRKDTGQLVTELEEDAFLTYLTELDHYLIAQYITYDMGENYGLLMNKYGETLAKFPRLCDIIGNTLYFNDPSGTIRFSRIYTLEELLVQGMENRETRK